MLPGRSCFSTAPLGGGVQSCPNNLRGKKFFYQKSQNIFREATQRDEDKGEEPLRAVTAMSKNFLKTSAEGEWLVVDVKENDKFHHFRNEERTRSGGVRSEKQTEKRLIVLVRQARGMCPGSIS